MANSTEDAEKQRQQALEAKRSEASYQESCRSSKENQCSTNSRKIGRLEGVKKTLEAEKQNAENARKRLKDYAENPDNFTDWYGKKYEEAQGAFTGDIIPQYDGYISRIDEALDAVCDKITSLENENMQLHWDILHIGSLLNSLWNEIEKLCN